MIIDMQWMKLKEQDWDESKWQVIIKVEGDNLHTQLHTKYTTTLQYSLHHYY